MEGTPCHALHVDVLLFLSSFSLLQNSDDCRKAKSTILNMIPISFS